MGIRSPLITTLLISVLTAAPSLCAANQFSINSTHPSTAIEQYVHANTHLLNKGTSSTVNINTADAEALALELKGIGQKRAESIVAYRDQHGPFSSIEELANIKGIGKKIIEQNRGKIII